MLYWYWGLLGAAAASSNHDGVVTTEKFYAVDGSARWRRRRWVSNAKYSHLSLGKALCARVYTTNCSSSGANYVRTISFQGFRLSVAKKKYVSGGEFDVYTTYVREEFSTLCFKSILDKNLIRM